jgi:hypothetical protein
MAMLFRGRHSGPSSMRVQLELRWRGCMMRREASVRLNVTSARWWRALQSSPLKTPQLN